MRLERFQTVATVTALTAYALIVHGYHPFSEDGGVYAAGIKWLLNPRLYSRETAFVTEHLRFSVFAPAMAGAVRLSHLPLAWVLLIGYVASVWATLYAGWMLVSRCTGTAAARWGGVSLVACWLTLPIAGTSLMLLDPYLTARSISTPSALFALAGALDILHGQRRRGWLPIGAGLAVALAVHPLMGGYALGGVLLLACVGAESKAVRRRGTLALCLLAVLAVALLHASSPSESPDYVRVAMTRYYWFPGQWEWYERLGLLGPAVVLGALMAGNRPATWRQIGTMALVLAGLSAAIAAMFCRAGLPTHLVARMQPLRSFQLVYLVMILLLGAWLGERVLQAKVWRWAAMLGGLGGLMFYVQGNVYPASAHLEMPWRSSPNRWVQAFVWAKAHTESDALFALDAHYITTPGEDAQTFRAIAERSALPDYSKDGGEAAIMPSLTDAWIAGQTAQSGLSEESDAARLAALRPLGVSWVVLHRAAETGFACPYGNDTVKVCRVP